MPRIICQVTDYGGPTGGSFIPALESLSRRVVENGDRFVVCSTRVNGATWPVELERAGAELHLVDSSRELVDVLARTRSSIIHAHFTRYDFPVLQAAGKSRVFWHVHSHRESASAQSRLKAWLKYRAFGRRVERLVPVSYALAEECVKFSAPRNWISVVQNGIDTQHFRPPAYEERMKARTLFGINESDRVVLFFERVPYKGGATVLKALEKAPHLRLLVVGGAKIDRDKFAVLPGVIAIERVADTRQLYWAADIMAFASDDEAFGFVLAEALASGLPVAATDIPIVHEVCGTAEQVFLFPVRDADALAQVLQRSFSTDGSNGRERMVAQFDINRWTTNMLALYE